MRIQPVNFVNYKRTNQSINQSSPFNVSFGMAKLPNDLKNYIFSDKTKSGEIVIGEALSDASRYDDSIPRGKFMDILANYKSNSDLMIKFLTAKVKPCHSYERLPLLFAVDEKDYYSGEKKFPLLATSKFYLEKAIEMLDKDVLFNVLTAKDKEGKTLMCYPCGYIALRKFSQSDVVKLLSFKNDLGKNPLHYSKRYLSLGLGKDEKRELFEAYIAKDNNGKTPLHNYKNYPDNMHGLKSFIQDFKDCVDLQKVFCEPDENGETLISSILSDKKREVHDQFETLKACGPYLTQETIDKLIKDGVIDCLKYARFNLLDDYCDANQFYDIYKTKDERGRYDIVFWGGLDTDYLKQMAKRLNAEQLEDIYSSVNCYGKTVLEDILSGKSSNEDKLLVLRHVSRVAPKQAYVSVMEHYEEFSEHYDCLTKLHLKAIISEILFAPKLDKESSLKLLEKYKDLFEETDYNLIRDEILKSQD